MDNGRPIVKTIVLVVLCCLALAIPASAQSSSSSYQVEEAFFGTGGDVDLNSSSYQGQAGVGALGVGETSSASYDGIAGFLTPNEPFLEMIVTGATVDFGTLSDTSTSSDDARAGVCNCSFTVRTYLTSEYQVLSISEPPTNEAGASLNPKTTQGPPSATQSVEEFGINLVDNTNPNIGADPQNQPAGDNSFADGRVSSGYDTINEFKYTVGDVIAQSPATSGNQAVGQTNYTISYIAKRSPITEAGTFIMDHVLVVVPTY